MGAVISSKADDYEKEKMTEDKSVISGGEEPNTNLTIDDTTKEIQGRIIAVNDFGKFNNVVKVILGIGIENPAEEITRLTQIRESDDYKWQNTGT